MGRVELPFVRGGLPRAALVLPSRVRPVWWGIAALAAAVWIIVATQASVDVFILNSALLAILGAVALNVLMGTAGQPSIGNAAFLAVGGYAAVFLLRTHYFAFPFDVIGAGVISAVVGLVVGVPALRLRGLYLILATLAAHFMIVFFATEYQGHVAGSGGIFINSEFASKGIASQQVYWAWLLFGIVAVVLLGSARLVRGRAGRAWRMIRDHELAAPTLGIQPTRYKLIVFSLSSGVIGVEGALFVHLNGSLIVDTFTLQLAIGYLAMVLIGGLDSIVGAVIGAAIVTYLPTKVPDIVSLFIGSGNAATKGPQISVIIYGVLIIVFIVSSPQGIVGWLKGFKLRLGRLSVRRRIGAARPAVD